MPDSDVHEIVVALHAYAANLHRDAEALRAGEQSGSPNDIYADAYAGCARDLDRIMAGSLTAEDLLT